MVLISKICLFFDNHKICLRISGFARRWVPSAFVAHPQKSVFCIAALGRERLPALQILLRNIASPVYLCAWLTGALTLPTGASEVHRFSRTSSRSDDSLHIHLQVTRLRIFRAVMFIPFRDLLGALHILCGDGPSLSGFARCCAPSHIPPACGGDLAALRLHPLSLAAGPLPNILKPADLRPQAFSAQALTEASS